RDGCRSDGTVDPGPDTAAVLVRAASSATVTPSGTQRRTARSASTGSPQVIAPTPPSGGWHRLVRGSGGPQGCDVVGLIRPHSPIPQGRKPSPPCHQSTPPPGILATPPPGPPCACQHVGTSEGSGR